MGCGCNKKNQVPKPKRYTPSPQKSKAPQAPRPTPPQEPA